ncbi:MAG: hypothetical protein ABIG44_05945 [Planctomycetota bacterium]
MSRYNVLRRMCLGVLFIALLGSVTGWADPYFSIRTFSEWTEALETQHVVPLRMPEWDSYMNEWHMYTEEGETYPETEFFEPVLYVYEGDPIPPHPDGDGGLVMAWGNESLPPGQYASAWKYDYLVDPDLSNAVITLTVYPPQFGPSGAITQISFGIQDMAGNTRSWFWNVGPGTSIPWDVGTPIVINTAQTGLNATVPPADGYMNNPAFNIVMTQYFIADENGQLVGGPVPVPPPGGPPAAVWNYWYDIIVQAGTTDRACCLPDGTCVYIPANDCFAQGGWLPPGGVCLGDLNGNNIDDACESSVDQACCLPDGTCVYIPASDCFAQGGWLPPGGVCLGDLNGNNIDDACEEPVEYKFEFSLDIGSDTELSDPFRDGDEGFDPGDVYWWQGPPVNFPGRDGFKDDMFIFGQDPWPDPPDPTYTTVAPVGSGGPQNYWEYFDLDGHDQLAVDFHEWQVIPPDYPLEWPIPQFDSPCIYGPEFLMISMDDDMEFGWPVMDVPVTRPSMAGVSSYGSTAGRDEILGVNVGPVGGPPPYPLQAVYPIADEVTVHQSLWPNPDTGEEELDDDVDSLDIVRNQDECPYWYFSADHEGHVGLDPGGIYQATGMGPVQIIDEIHLGIPEDTDIDAFEFVWLEYELEPGMLVLALLYSVDTDDPLTPNANESGGMDPTMIYASYLTGWSLPFTEPLGDDIDALTIWYRPLEEPEPTGACCLGRICNVMTFNNCVAAGGFYMGDGVPCTPNPCVAVCCHGYVCYDVDPNDPTDPNNQIQCLSDGGEFFMGVTCATYLCDCGGTDYRGDSNCLGDGVDAYDIDHFIQSIGAADTWISTHSCNYFCANDINCDGDVNSYDIDWFITCVGAGACPACP